MPLLNPLLLVPLSKLSKAPIGAPVAWCGWPDHADRAKLILVGVFQEREELLAMLVSAGDCGAARFVVPQAYVHLDLTPPHPPFSRVDGLSLGLELLGWKPGDETYIVSIDGIAFLDTGVWRRSTQERIERDGPLALRLAVAAMLRSGAAR